MQREKDIETIQALKDSLPPEQQKKLIEAYGPGKEKMKLPEKKQTKNGVNLINMDDVEIKTVEWLWLPYIPLGKVTIMQGDPGQGKTTLSLALASIVSRGGSFPSSDGHYVPVQGNVIYQTAEDGIADTIKPRLVNAKADCSKIFVIDESKNRLTLSDPRLEEALKEKRPRLLIIDPIQAYLGENVDMHRANETRPVLSHLGNLAEKYSCAVVVIAHMSKASGVSPLQKLLGSSDISAAVRSVLLVGSNPDNPEDKAIIHIKSNLAKMGDPIGFRITEDRGIVFGTPTTLTADMIIGNAKAKQRNSAALDDAIDFLNDALANGEVEARVVKTMADNEYISSATLRRAAKQLSVVIRQEGKGENRHSYWSLPHTEEKDKNILTPSFGTMKID